MERSARRSLQPRSVATPVIVAIARTPSVVQYTNFSDSMAFPFALLDGQGKKSLSIARCFVGKLRKKALRGPRPPSAQRTAPHFPEVWQGLTALAETRCPHLRSKSCLPAGRLLPRDRSPRRRSSRTKQPPSLFHQ